MPLDEKDAIENLENSEEELEELFIKDLQTINYKHKENNYVDFNIERLLPFMRSTEGPKMTFGDVNGDGWDDLFIFKLDGDNQYFFSDRKGGFDEALTPCLSVKFRGF